MGYNGGVILALVCLSLDMNVCVLKWLFSSFVVIKIIVGVNLVGYATRRRAGMEQREAADAVNNFGRDPIGEGKEEQVLSVSPLFLLTSAANALFLQSSNTIKNSRHCLIAIVMICPTPRRWERIKLEI